MVTRSLGAGRPSFPKADPGTKYGAATAPAAFRNSRRERIVDVLFNRSMLFLGIFRSMVFFLFAEQAALGDTEGAVVGTNFPNHGNSERLSRLEKLGAMGQEFAEPPIWRSVCPPEISAVLGISPRTAFAIEKRPFYVTEDGKGPPCFMPRGGRQGAPEADYQAWLDTHAEGSMALEWIDTPEARGLLHSLAQQYSNTALGHAARETFDRLRRQASEKRP
jgi:hypothetical protein